MKTNDKTTLEGREDFLYRCVRCSNCKNVPIIKSEAFASICPSIDYGTFHSYSAGGQVIMGKGLVEEKIDYSPGMIDAVSACTMCGGCDVSCKINFSEIVEPLDSLYALRSKIVKDGQSPASHRRMMENIKKEGNDQAAPRTSRVLWSQALSPALSAQPNSDVLIHVGSVLSYDVSKHASLQSIVSSIRDAGKSVAYLGEEEGSSGATAFDLGYQDESRKLASEFVDQVTRLKVSTLVTFSAAAIAAYRGIYPRLGLDFGNTRVLHITEYIMEMLSSGELELSKDNSLKQQKVAYHDSCKLGRMSEEWVPHDLELDKVMGAYYVSRAPELLRFGNNGIYEAPRELLQAMGLDLVELERSRGASYCCGATGGVKESVPEAASLAASNRLSEMSITPTNTLVSGCGNCAAHLEKNASDELKVLDLIDVLAESLHATKSTASEGA